jgi:ABC-2 type transport system permease protein
MAVYSNHNRHQPYQGLLTGPLERFMIIPRYAFRSLSESKIFLLLFTGCFTVPISCLLLIYLNHNMDAIMMLGIDPKDLNLIGNTFFLRITEIQCILAFFLMALVAPGLLLPDMRNNGLPLYFSRPVAKPVYLGGKLSVLIAIQSVITWVPLTLLYIFQSGLAGGSWFLDHADILWAIFFGSIVWILVTSLIAITVSSMVRWKAAGGALLLGVVFIASGMGEAINEIFNTRYGSLFNLIYMFEKIWEWLFSINASGNVIVVPASEAPYLSLSLYWLDLAVIALVCLALLWRKIRAFEVVK